MSVEQISNILTCMTISCSNTANSLNVLSASGICLLTLLNADFNTSALLYLYGLQYSLNQHESFRYKTAISPLFSSKCKLVFLLLDQVCTSVSLNKCINSSMEHLNMSFMKYLIITTASFARNIDLYKL